MTLGQQDNYISEMRNTPSQIMRKDRTWKKEQT